VADEQSPEVLPEPAPTSAPALKVEDVPRLSASAAPIAFGYQDRSSGLVIFGVMQIVLGLLAALLVPLAALGAFLTRFAAGAAMRPGQYISGMATYAVVAAVLLTLGIGSVQKKRWARALTLVISWYWLITGVLITVLMTAVLPVTMRTVLRGQQNAAGQSAAVPAGVMAVILTLVIVLAAVFLILVPIAFVVFYSRNDVAETCCQHDPVERWTDRTPLPILGASVVFVTQAVYLISTGLTAPMFPFFGHYVTGASGRALFLVFAVLDAYLGIAFFRLKPLAWWIAIVAAPVRLLSMAVTFGRADLVQAYAKLGWSDTQLQMLNSSPLVRSHMVLWWSLISSVLFVGYILWLRRYFGTAIAPAQPEAVPVHSN
jgi:hypothetical protein